MLFPSIRIPVVAIEGLTIAPSNDFSRYCRFTACKSISAAPEETTYRPPVDNCRAKSCRIANAKLRRQPRPISPNYTWRAPRKNHDTVSNQGMGLKVRLLLRSEGASLDGFLTVNNPG